MSAAHHSVAAETLGKHEHGSIVAGHRLQYMTGPPGTELRSESLAGALPVFGNNPQICNYGLYAEQLSGTAFTVPRAKNQRSWLYRIRPSVLHSKFVPLEQPNLKGDFAKEHVDPNQVSRQRQQRP